MYSFAIHVIIYRPEGDMKKRICFLPKNIRFVSRNRRNINNVINDSQEAQKVNYYFICSGNTFAAHSCYAEFFHTKLFCAAMSKLIGIAVFFFVPEESLCPRCGKSSPNNVTSSFSCSYSLLDSDLVHSNDAAAADAEVTRLEGCDAL